MKQPLLLTCSRKLACHWAIEAFMQVAVSFVSSHYKKSQSNATAVLAWGRKPSATKAENLARQLNLPLWRLEDGFIHSLGQGVLGAASCSLVVDKTGIYYDATQPSDLENILAKDPEGALADAGLLLRANRLIKQITVGHISKYNNAPLILDHLNLPESQKVLLVDQTAGDMSLKYGLVEADATAILQTVLDEQPAATILLKAHPDVMAGKKKGFFPSRLNHPRIKLIAEPVNPLVLLQRVEHVYVLTSQLGFEALLLGKPVTCFGVPFYAGWGVTDDRADHKHPVFQRRNRQRSVTEIFAAAYLLYSRYVHPDRLERCEAEEIVKYFAAQNRLFRENKGQLYAFGFSRWKRNYIHRFLYSPDNRLHFTNTVCAALKKGFNADSHLITWGERATAEANKLSRQYNVPLWRVEDGFIRSAGLGSDYTPPLSLVLDKHGIYYDPGQVSDLEHLLEHHDFSPELLQRAQNLRALLLKYALSKYNLGETLLKEQIAAKPGQCILLVPGQVEDDASIRKGCRDINNNTALLREVRHAHPDAYIIYKPHPDVVSGNRKGRVADEVIRACSDRVLDDISITDCLDLADEVHTMTSLVGFEGLLRHKKVVCYGLPFYAGWGLTQDRHRLERRRRKLNLDQLVAATLILYPRYINWQTGTFTTPEFTLEYLYRQLLAQGGKKKNKIHVIRRSVTKVIHVWHGFVSFRS